MPDLSWTGYDTHTFIKKFHGFIPNNRKIGQLSIDHTGYLQVYERDMLIFKSLEKGVFYKKRNDLINLSTGNIKKIDSVMLKWIAKNQNIYVLDKKPKNEKYFSILGGLKENKKLNGIVFKYGSLYDSSRNKPLKTHFMKQEIRFNERNLTDIIYNVETKTIELECLVGDKKITFETDGKLEKFEVANIV